MHFGVKVILKLYLSSNAQVVFKNIFFLEESQIEKFSLIVVNWM